MIKKIILVLTTSLLFLVPSGAYGNSFQMSVQIRENCSLAAPTLTLEPGQGELRASLFESCNVGDGFIIRAMHRPLADSERASISYANGEFIDLSNVNSTTVAERRGAKYGYRELLLSSQNIETPLTIQFALERR